MFLELKRRKQECFYHNEKYECDFVIKKGAKIRQAIQVCYEINDKNKKREFDGLKEAMKSYGLKQGLIITHNQSETIKEKNQTIIIIPAWRWLLEIVDKF